MNYQARWGLDRSPKEARSAWIRAKKASKLYARRLRALAKHIGDIVKGFDVNSPEGVAAAQDTLRRYAAVIAPWAEAEATKMVASVAMQDRVSWKKTSAEMGRLLHKEIETAPIGAQLREAKARQVELITSLPLEAAQRVHDLTTKGVTEGKRADEIAKEILRTGDVTKSRATLIARTEVSRTATELTRVRAQHVGSTHFVWRTAGDSDVRPSHRALNGKSFAWDDPPECDPGYHALPGAIWNCRCYPEPVIAD